MGTRFGMAAALALAALALGAAARAEEPKVALRWALDQGERVRYRLTLDQTATQALDGRSFETRQGQVLDVSFTVKELGEDRTMRCLCRFERVAIDLDQMMLGKLVWASDGPEAEKRWSDPGIRPFSALVGKEIGVDVRPDGTVPPGGVRGYDALRDAILDPVKGNPMAVAALESALGQEAMRTLFERTFRVVPPGPVAVGETWEVRADQPAPILGTIAHTATLKLVALEGGKAQRARIGIAVRLAAGQAAAPSSAMLSAVAVELLEGEGTGEALFAVDSGRLVHSTMTLSMRLRAHLTEPHAAAEGPGARRVETQVRQVVRVEAQE